MGQEPNHLKQHIGYWLNRLRNAVHQSFESRLAKYEISVASWVIMVAIYDKQANSINTLAQYIDIDKATISRVAEKLVVRKLLVHKEGKDRRSGIIELTPKGKALVPKLIKEAEQNELQFFGNLSKRQTEQLRATMHTIVSNIPSINVDGWLLNKTLTKE
jgi:DNA-binding MarR family transcriptional regulator